MKNTVKNIVPKDKSVYIGQRLRELRSACGFSQSELAEKTGVSFQQIQKYEKGINRISADRLYDIAKILNVKIADFFEHLDFGNKKSSLKLAEGENNKSLKPNVNSKESSALLREYYKISSPERRKKVLDIIKELAKEG